MACKGGEKEELERVDLVDKRGSHYGTVPASAVLPVACACLAGHTFWVPHDLGWYLRRRYGCIGVVGIDCELDPTFLGRGIYYRAIEQFELPTLLAMRAKLSKKKYSGGRW